jgi:o-succinylbenzoate synthase
VKITEIKTGRIAIPLKKPFKTALRTLGTIENVVVRVTADTGQVGYGEAAATAVITGETIGSIIYAVEEIIAPVLMGMAVENIEAIMLKLDQCLVRNTSAKAAVDLAVYDLYGQLYRAPLYKLLGGYRETLTTDLTISVNEPDQMAHDSTEAVALGYDVLKIKVGKEPALDLQRLQAVRAAVGDGVKLRVDANQGWQPKEAVSLINQMADAGLQIELVEQPVAAHDLEGLQFVTERVAIPILADESVFSPWDAVKLLQMRAADLLNIKLMKTGGIHHALHICALAETYGVECMIGCMMETKISVTAAVHLAAAKRIITRVDLDSPILCAEDPIGGGAIYNEARISLGKGAGLGFGTIGGVEYGAGSQ